MPEAEGRFLDTFYDIQAFRALGWFLVYSSVAICVIRGLPVIYDAMYYLRDEPEVDTTAPRERPVSTLAAERGERGTSI